MWYRSLQSLTTFHTLPGHGRHHISPPRSSGPPKGLVSVRDLCRQIVLWFRDFWTWLGWVLFILFVVGPLFTTSEPLLSNILFLGAGLLLMVWWLIDVIDQMVSAWTIALGLLMLAIGVLPGGFVLQLAAFILYMTRVRESDAEEGVG
jgi:hypothetical protein